MKKDFEFIIGYTCTEFKKVSWYDGIEDAKNLIRTWQKFNNIWSYDESENMVTVFNPHHDFCAKFFLDFNSLLMIAERLAKLNPPAMIPVNCENYGKETRPQKQFKNFRIPGIKHKVENYYNASSITYYSILNDFSLKIMIYENDNIELANFAIKNVMKKYNFLQSSEKIEQFKEQLYSELRNLFDTTKGQPVLKDEIKEFYLQQKPAKKQSKQIITEPKTEKQADNTIKPKIELRNEILTQNQNVSELNSLILSKIDEIMKADLTLTIKKTWLQKIISGEKTEEYRDYKDYYHKLFKKFDNETHCVIDPPKTLKLRAGYSENSPYAIVEVEKIRLEQFFGETKPIPEGFKTGEKAYTIYISKVIEQTLN